MKTDGNSLMHSFNHIENCEGNMDGLTKREYFASQAMAAAVSESQELVTDGLFNWIKNLLYTYLHLGFLSVKYKEIKGGYSQAADRAVKYADALINELNKTS